MGTLADGIRAIMTDVNLFMKTTGNLYTSYPNSDVLILVDNDTGVQQSVDSPPTGEPWAKVDLLLAAADVITVGVNGEDEQRGILQLSLNYPLLTGHAALYQMYDLLRARWPAGKSLNYNGTIVTILQCRITEPSRMDSYFRAYVSVEWRIRHTRATP